MSIQIRHVSKQFGSFRALNDLSLDIETGELIALLGPSGCGKTTLLRIIAGLDTPDTGKVLVQGEDTSGLAVQKRNVGFVFQHYALFRHMTVFDNVAFGLRVRPRSERSPEKEIRGRVNRLLELVQIDWMSDRYPEQLSGGQRQRVALARALAVEPRILLLDEPFGALDAKVRKDLRRWLRRLHDELNVTSVFVTHDQEEALEVADRVVVMNHGRVEQIGTPEDVYDRPATPFVFEFLGHVNRLPTRDGGEAFTRPHEFVVERQPGPEAWAARFVHGTAIGPVARLEFALEPSAHTVNVELPREQFRGLALRAGEIAYLTPTRRHAFEAR